MLSIRNSRGKNAMKNLNSNFKNKANKQTINQKQNYRYREHIGGREQREKEIGEEIKRYKHLVAK